MFFFSGRNSKATCNGEMFDNQMKGNAARLFTEIKHEVEIIEVLLTVTIMKDMFRQAEYEFNSISKGAYVGFKEDRARYLSMIRFY